MRDSEFGEMAYKLGPTKQIRDKILESALRGDHEGDAQKAVVWHIRLCPTKTEAIWLRKYDAAMRQGTLEAMKGGAQ